MLQHLEEPLKSSASPCWPGHRRGKKAPWGNTRRLEQKREMEKSSIGSGTMGCILDSCYLGKLWSGKSTCFPPPVMFCINNIGNWSKSYKDTINLQGCFPTSGTEPSSGYLWNFSPLRGTGIACSTLISLRRFWSGRSWWGSLKDGKLNQKRADNFLLCFYVVFLLILSLS